MTKKIRMKMAGTMRSRPLLSWKRFCRNSGSVSELLASSVYLRRRAATKCQLAQVPMAMPMAIQPALRPAR